MLKLGTECKEIAASLTGMLTHMQLDMSGQVFYRFQPKGINPKTGEPVDGYWIDPSRVMGGIEIADEELPVEVLGTYVEDKASGFGGTAIALIYHTNGCVHFDVQAPGVLPSTGCAIKSCNFDVRRLTGDAIKNLSESELAVSKKTRPSPEEVSSYRPS